MPTGPLAMRSWTKCAQGDAGAELPKQLYDGLSEVPAAHVLSEAHLSAAQQHRCALEWAVWRQPLPLCRIPPGACRHR